MSTSSEILAQIAFLSTKNGGRSVPFGQGFSPKLVFDSSPCEYFTIFNLSDSDTLFPGDQIKLQLQIKGNPGIHLHKGASFILLEGQRTIGSGTIMDILNEQ